MKKFTLLILVMLLGITGVNAEDAITTWSDKNWSSEPKSFSWNNETLLTRGNEAINIGDVITVTFTRVNSGSATQVVLRAKDTGIVSEYYDANADIPSTVSFTLSARERDAFRRYGLNLSGNNISVTAVTKTARYSGGNNSVWVGSSDGWNSVNKDIISDIKAGDRIVVHMSKKGENTEFEFGYRDSNWAGQPFTAGTDYIKTNTNATLYVTETIATTLRGSNGLYVDGKSNYTYTSIDLITEDQTADLIYTPASPLVFDDDENFDIPTEYLKGYSAGDKMIFTISAVTAPENEKAQLSVKENDWTWISRVSDNIATTDDIELEITEGMLNANKSLPLHLSGKYCTVSKITFKPKNVYVTIGSEKYATYSCEQAIDFTGKDVEAYYASDKAEGSVTLTRIYKVPANTGLLLYSETPNKYSIPVTSETTESISTNYLKKNVTPTSVSASTDGSYHYIFAKKGDETPGFYKLTADHTLADHKAYLEISSSVISGARVALRFSDITDIQDVRAIEKKSEDNAYYNLSGQRIAKPTKGIYIKNGKKYVVK